MSGEEEREVCGIWEYIWDEFGDIGEDSVGSYILSGCRVRMNHDTAEDLYVRLAPGIARRSFSQHR